MPLKPKTYSFLTGNNDEKKSKRHKNVMLCKENLHLKTINIVQKQLNLKMK